MSLNQNTTSNALSIDGVRAAISAILRGQPTRAWIGAVNVDPTSLTAFSDAGHRVIDPETLTPIELSRLVQDSFETGSPALILCYPKGTSYTHPDAPERTLHRTLTTGTLAQRIIWLEQAAGDTQGTS